MKRFEDLQNVDVYLIDQLLKGRIQKDMRILDAGCGSGRNMSLFLKEGFDITGIDSNLEVIQEHKNLNPSIQERFIHASLEAYRSDVPFDFIICNAVLHFAQNEGDFDAQIAGLMSNLRSGGVLFIRMTSNIGIELPSYDAGKVLILPDESTRYLIDRNKIDQITNKYSLQLIDPVKSTNVSDLRSMTTIVWSK